MARRVELANQKATSHHAKFHVWGGVVDRPSSLRHSRSGGVVKGRKGRRGPLVDIGCRGHAHPSAKQSAMRDQSDRGRRRPSRVPPGRKCNLPQTRIDAQGESHTRRLTGVKKEVQSALGAAPRTGGREDAATLRVPGALSSEGRNHYGARNRAKKKLRTYSPARA